MPTWLAVQQSKAVFFLTLFDSSNDTKHCLTVCITPHPFHSLFFFVDCCQFDPSWIFWAENRAYGLLADIQLEPNLEQSTTKMAVARMRCNADSSDVFHIIDTNI